VVAGTRWWDSRTPFSAPTTSRAKARSKPFPYLFSLVALFGGFVKCDLSRWGGGDGKLVRLSLGQTLCDASATRIGKTATQ